MARRERVVAGNMPVLGERDVREMRCELVDDRHDRIAPRHGQRPAGEKVVLHIDHQKDVAVGQLHRHTDNPITTTTSLRERNMYARFTTRIESFEPL